MSVSSQIDKVGVDLLNDMSCKNKKRETMVTVATCGGVGEQLKHCMGIGHSPCFHLKYRQPNLKGQLNEFNVTNLFYNPELFTIGWMIFSLTHFATRPSMIARPECQPPLL